MGVMYAWECDLCGDIQVKKNAHEIKGKSYSEDGKTKFSCSACQGKLMAALALGKGGLDDPLKAVAGLLEMKDQEMRNLELRTSAQSGDMMGVADELRKKREGGSFIPVAGLDFESQHRAMKRLHTTDSTTTKPHALPAPEPNDKPKKRKK